LRDEVSVDHLSPIIAQNLITRLDKLNFKNYTEVLNRINKYASHQKSEYKDTILKKFKENGFKIEDENSLDPTNLDNVAKRII